LTVLRALLAVTLLALTTPVPADTLENRLAGVSSLAGRFQQTLFSREGEALEESSGTFSLLRPGYLSWHILEPDEQLLLASNETLWHYDVELETATRREIPAGNPTSPLTILGGDSTVLVQWYRVEQLSEERWQLEPRFEGAEFTSVELGFAGGLPVEMQIRDNLGRSTVISLTELDTREGLSPADFAFEPPAGIDIYSSDEL
jgi:outer membrane lipoprotein carrier protein